jgi:hypothetical protein
MHRWVIDGALPRNTPSPGVTHPCTVLRHVGIASSMARDASLSPALRCASLPLADAVLEDLLTLKRTGV